MIKKIKSHQAYRKKKQVTKKEMSQAGPGHFYYNKCPDIKTSVDKVSGRKVLVQEFI